MSGYPTPYVDSIVCQCPDTDVASSEAKCSPGYPSYGNYNRE